MPLSNRQRLSRESYFVIANRHQRLPDTANIWNRSLTTININNGIKHHIFICSKSTKNTVWSSKDSKEYRNNCHEVCSL